MINEALLNCADKLNLYESLFDVEKFITLDDTIINRIEYIENGEQGDLYYDSGLARAKGLIRRIKHRDIYKYVSECVMDKTTFQNKYLNQEEKVRNDILCNIKQNNGIDRIELKDIHIVYGHTNYGFKDQNPVDRVQFYEKYQDNRKFYLEKDQISQLLPCKFYEKFIRIFVDGNAQKIQKVKDAFYQYCSTQGLNQGQQKIYNQYSNHVNLDSQQQNLLINPEDAEQVGIQNETQKSFSEYLSHRNSTNILGEESDLITKKTKI